MTRCEAICRRLEAGVIQLSDTESSHLYPLLSSIEALLISIVGEEHRDKLYALIAERVIPLCFRMADIISPILHSTSPEGFVPEELLESIDDVELAETIDSTSQLLLVNCWRSHKAISHLLGFVSEELPYQKLLTPLLLRQIGDYFWLQLTQCRHCGAFSSAADGFEKFCKRLWTLHESIEGESCATSNGVNGELPAPGTWLKRLILDDCEGEENCMSVTSFTTSLC